MKSVVFVFFTVLVSALSQTGDNLDGLISQIFTKPEKDVTGKNPPPDLTPAGGGGAGSNEICEKSGGECVPYYLCNSTTNSVITDGMGLIDIRIQEDKVSECADYLSVCCNAPDQVDTPITPRPDENKPKGCGVRNPNGVGFRIEGDKDNESQFGEFPWMVAVLREEVVEGSTQKLLIYQCGASLIHPQVVLTSAHCVASREKQYKIRAGEWDTQTKNELFAHQDRDVKAIIIHPEYYAGALYNDVALLILESSLEIMDNVDVVCLPRQGEAVPPSTRCFASGWGKDVFGKEGKYQVILKKIDLPIVQHNICQDKLRTTRLGKHFKLHDSFICAGGEPGKDTCKGDGGSPLVCPIPGQANRFFQAGIVAWGIGCGENQIPGVYANIAKFTNWIEQQLQANSLDSAPFTY